MNRRILSCWIITLAAVLLVLPRSVEAQLALYSFTVSGNPNPLTNGQLLTLTANVIGDSQTPAGSVDFFLTGDSTCSSRLSDLGTAVIDYTGTATAYTYNVSPGTDQICGTYIPDQYSPYPGETTNQPFVVTVDSGLSVLSPGATAAGTPSLTVTLSGQGFTSSSIVQLGGSEPIALATTYVSSTKLRVALTANLLQEPGTLLLNVLTGSYTTNSLQFTVYQPSALTLAASASPAAFTYGQTLTASFAASLTRNNPLAPGVPTGNATFSLAGSQNYTLGTVPLTPAAASRFSPGDSGALDIAPQKVLAADLNGDGIADMVSEPVTFPNLPTWLQVELGNGANGFQTEEQVDTGCTPQDFVIGDLNHDNIPDLVVVCYQNEDPPPIAVYLLGNGDGTFQAPVPFAADTTLDFPDFIAVGDFNGDGAIDVVLADIVDGAIQIYNGSTTFGTFTAQTQLPLTDSIGPMSGIAVADFNEDGKSDLAILETTSGDPGTLFPGEVLLLTSNGTGFSTAATQEFQLSTFAGLDMTITDLNGDGFPDVAIADPGGSSAQDPGQLFVFENNGSGVLNPGISIAAPGASAVAGPAFPVVGKPSASAPANPSWNIAAASLDSTGTVITVTAFQRQSASSYTQTASWTTSAAASEYLTFAPLAAGDLNADGFLDLAVIASTGTAAQIVPGLYSNDANATLTNSAQLPIAGTYNLTASYPGNLIYAGGSSPGFQVVLNPATPGAALSGPSTATYGQTVTFTVTMSGVPGGTVPTGTVQFLDGGAALGSPQTLVAGAAQLSTSALTAGPHTITAAYSGGANYTPLASFGSVSVNVAPGTFALNLTSSVTSITAGAVVTFDVQATGNPLPVGQAIAFTGLPTAAAAPALDATGHAVYRFGLFAPGTYTIQASYNGDSTFAKSTSNQLTLQVADTPVAVSLTSSANPVTNPAPITLTAGVTSSGFGVPAGAITFQNNGTAVGTAQIAVVNGTSGFSSTGSFVPTSNNVTAIATGDFNHDGKTDMVVLETSDGAATLLISIGNGDGTFQAPATYNVDASAIALAAGDFNGDGYTDLAVAASDGTVAIYLADADAAGDLRLSQTLNAGNVTGIAAGDFNKDGSPDLAVIGNNTISAYPGSTSGTFATTPFFTLASETSSYAGVVVADFNQDGNADIAVTDSYNSSVTVLLYSPSTSRFAATTYPIGVFGSAIVAGDFNGDKYPDLAVLSRGDSTVDVLINDGSGSFNSGVSYAATGEPTALASADFNGDGYADLAITGVAGGQGGGTAILLGSRSGAMTGESSLSTTYGYSVASADLNGDGHPDLLVGFNGVAAFVDSAAQATLSNLVLPAGTAPLTAAYAGSTTFSAATSNTVSEVVNPAPPALALTAVDPATAYLGSPVTTITLTGAGFTPNSQALLKGAPLVTNYVSATQLTAVIPAVNFQQIGTFPIAVSDSGVTTTGIVFSVLAQPVQVQLSGPGTAAPGQQPSLNFSLQQAYPVDIQGTFTLTVQPAVSGGPVDPAVQFATGGDTFTFTLPANTTTTPAVQLQTGTLAATITVTLTLQAGGTDITPASLQPVVITVPPAAPTISSVTLARSGDTLTVTVQGFSSTRDMKTATFDFTPASGATLASPQVVVDIGQSFATWYAEDTSVQYGSAFSYVQTFTLTSDATTVQNVSVTLANSIGTSNARSAQ